MKLRFRISPRRSGKRGHSVAIVAGVVVAGSAAYGAYSSSEASSKAGKAAQAQNAAQAQQAQGQQAALQAMYDNQKQPDEIFKSVFSSMPELLGGTMPAFIKQANATATQETASNVSTYNQTLSSLFPGYAQQQARQLAVIQGEDPANLGKQQLDEMSRQLSPFIATGSVNPKSGQVGNGLASPDQLYRNAISGMYQQRTQQFLSDNSAWTNNAQNAAQRQQVQAPSFLSGFLNLASGNAANITTQSVSQQQSNIGAQTGLLQSIISQPRAQFNPAQFQQMTNQGISSGLGGLMGAIKGMNGPSSGYGVSGGSGLSAGDYGTSTYDPSLDMSLASSYEY